MNKYFYLTIIIILSLFSLSCNHNQLRKTATPPQDNRGKIIKISNEGESIEGKSVLSSYTGSYALLIGESDYSKAWPDLNSIPGELTKVETVLTEQGFKVEKSLNLNSSELELRFKKFINDYGYQKNNRLLFFYSGHGHTDNGKGFLVPVDAPNPDIDKIGFLQKSLRMSDILAIARRIEAKHALFLFDSCFSGSVFKARELPKVSRQITKLAQKPVRQFITAGSDNETVPAKSVFTPAFVDALRYGLGDLTHDGYITGQELGFYLQYEVPKHANQTPQYGKIRDYDLSRGDFIFIVRSQAGTVNNQQKQLAEQAEIARLNAQIATSQSQLEQQVAATTAKRKTKLEQLRQKKAEIARKAELARLASLKVEAEEAEAIKAKVLVEKKRLQAQKLHHGKVFQDRLKDGSLGPKMVRIKAGSFRMGSIQEGGDDDEKPVHRISVSAFSIGKYEVTFAEYDKFAKAKGINKPNDKGWGRGNRPVINVSWDYATAYAKWLSKQTGKKYRLPTEAEWEYAARAGTETKYWWGNQIGSNNGVCYDCGSRWDDKKTAPVGSFGANQFGLYDTVGNVWEWVHDIYYSDYYRISSSSNPEGPSEENQTSLNRVGRGGAWHSSAQYVRTASRYYIMPAVRSNGLGFRLAREP